MSAPPSPRIDKRPSRRWIVGRRFRRFRWQLRFEHLLRAF
jgi:hypothetical protein